MNILQSATVPQHDETSTTMHTAECTYSDAQPPETSYTIDITILLHILPGKCNLCNTPRVTQQITPICSVAESVIAKTDAQCSGESPCDSPIA